MSSKPLLRLAWLPLAVLIICLVVWAAPTAAQGPGLAIDEASLRLWPEYDDPGLLVILSGTFTGTGAFPQKVAFPVPAGGVASRRRWSPRTAICSSSRGRSWTAN